MTLFGLIWMLLSVWAVYRKQVTMIVVITVLGMVWQCNNMIVLPNGLSCGPQLITSAVFLAKSCLYQRGYRFRRMTVYEMLWLFLLAYVFVNVFILFTPSNKLALQVLMLSVYVFTFFQMRKLSVYIDMNVIRRCCWVLSVVILSIGAVQMIVEGFGLPKDTILSALVYNDTGNPNIIYHTKNEVRLYSTFMEPSYCAAVLVGLFAFYFLDRDALPFRRRMILLGVLLAAILFTRSSTAYGTVFVVMALYILIYGGKKRTWALLGLGAVVLLFLLLQFDLLNSVIFNKFNSASGRVRNRLNLRALRCFLTSPLTGTGYRSCRASSIFFSLLGELGILGTAPYLAFAGYMIWLVIRRRHEDRTFLATAYMVLVSVTTQIIACPDLDLCSFWLTMYLFALGYGVQTEQKRYLIVVKNTEREI